MEGDWSDNLLRHCTLFLFNASSFCSWLSVTDLVKQNVNVFWMWLSDLQALIYIAAWPSCAFRRPICALPIQYVHYSCIWTESSMPSALREATVILIPKPNKDCYLASTYRPVSLSSCLCKTVEHMVNCHLVRVLESWNLSIAQCGFWHCRSTLDHLVTLE
jgi:hypothetical protein